MFQYYTPSHMLIALYVCLACQHLTFCSVHVELSQRLSCIALLCMLDPFFKACFCVVMISASGIHCCGVPDCQWKFAHQNSQFCHFYPSIGGATPHKILNHVQSFSSIFLAFGTMLHFQSTLLKRNIPN